MGFGEREEGRLKILDMAWITRKTRIRIMRDKELAKKDIDMLRAIESGDSSAQSTVATDKQTLRDIPANFDLTTGVDTPVQLKAKWPDGLPTE